MTLKLRQSVRIYRIVPNSRGSSKRSRSWRNVEINPNSKYRGKWRRRRFGRAKSCPKLGSYSNVEMFARLLFDNGPYGETGRNFIPRIKQPESSNSPHIVLEGDRVPREGGWVQRAPVFPFPGPSHHLRRFFLPFPPDMSLHQRLCKRIATFFYDATFVPMKECLSLRPCRETTSVILKSCASKPLYVRTSLDPKFQARRNDANFFPEKSPSF